MKISWSKFNTLSRISMDAPATSKISNIAVWPSLAVEEKGEKRKEDKKKTKKRKAKKSKEEKRGWERDKNAVKWV